jgi:ribose/xylose/arabinose/galactoside ABC-type transport system permease subunit
VRRVIATLGSVTRHSPIRGQQLALLLLVVALAIIFTTAQPAYASARSLDNILRTASMFGIAGLGMTLVIITGGIDLSVGSMMALGGAVGAGLLGIAFGAANPVQLPALLAIPIALMVTGLFGATSGTIITRLNLAPFVVTLGMMSIARGATYLFASFAVQKVSGTAITFSDSTFDWLGAGSFGPLPTQAAIFLALALAVAFVLRSTNWGRNVFAVGGNQEDARLAGISISRVIIPVFALSGVLAGLAGLLLTGKLSSASPLAALGYELNVIMVVVIGGTSLAGGRGSVLGTVLGAIVISMLDNGLNMLNVPSFNQYLLKGTILIAAVVADRMLQARAGRFGTGHA